jgi:hypothetical protein
MPKDALFGVLTGVNHSKTIELMEAVFAKNNFRP